MSKKPSLTLNGFLTAGPDDELNGESYFDHPAVAAHHGTRGNPDAADGTPRPRAVLTPFAGIAPETIR